jgi:uncharacterized protein with HEPN domain/predicted nucleotidyltransferase
MPARIELDRAAIAEFCRRHHIVRMALFGSVLREDFQPDSDVDVLVEFDPEHVPGIFGLGAMEDELAPLLGGRKPDLVTVKSLNHRIRDAVLASAEPVYGRARLAPRHHGGARPMPKDDSLYLHHMRDNAAKARELLAGKQRADFDADEVLRRALAYTVQIIGEAASRVSPKTKEAHSDIEWHRIVGMRHRLVHDYLAIDEDILWQVVSRDLETLLVQLDRSLPGRAG